MRVFAVQLDVIWEDKAANFERVRRLLAPWEIPAGSLVILPEMFSTGFSMNVEKTRQGNPPEAERFLADLARETGAAVLGGVVGNQVGKPYNEAVAFAPDGRLLVRYAKIHPFSLAQEGNHYASGQDVQIFAWGGFHIAPFVCYDLRFPEIFRAAMDQGATLGIVVAQWLSRRAAHWPVLLQARAIENQCFMVGVNRCGIDPVSPYPGLSCAIDPWGKVLVEAGDTETVLTCELDPLAVSDAREKFSALKDRRWGVSRLQESGR